MNPSSLGNVFCTPPHVKCPHRSLDTGPRHLHNVYQHPQVPFKTLPIFSSRDHKGLNRVRGALEGLVDGTPKASPTKVPWVSYGFQLGTVIYYIKTGNYVGVSR